MRSFLLMGYVALGRRHGQRIVAGTVRAFALLRRRHAYVAVNNTKLTVDMESGWGVRAYYIEGRYDIAQIRAARTAVDSEFTFVDVGANLGAWTFSLADHFQRVIAIEPNRECVACLEATQLRQGRPNVTVLAAGLSDHDGTGTMFTSRWHLGDGRIYDPGHTDQRREGRIDLFTFDEVAKRLSISDRVFMKLDVQGVEPQVLRGMTSFLKTARDVVIWTELSAETLASAGESIDDYLELLRGKGFAPVNMEAGLQPMSWDAARQLGLRQKDCCFRRTVAA